MKRISVILLIALYLIPTVGFSLKVHYCAGKLSSVSFTFIDTKECACGKKMKKGCCKTETSTFKLQDAQKHTPQFTFDNSHFNVQPEINTISEFVFQPTKKVESSIYFKQQPPDEIEQPLYILNRVFRI